MSGGGRPTVELGSAAPSAASVRTALAADPVRTDDGRPVRLAIVDYGMGNRRSVEKAFEHAGAPVAITDDLAVIAAADGLVLCGVGAFPAGVQRLTDLGLDGLLRDRVRDGVPLLGICLGMQLLFERSDERGGASGLGLLAGSVRRLTVDGGLKLPHIGWNQVRWTPPASVPSAEPIAGGRPVDAAATIRGGLPDAAAFYHVHSYVAHPEDPAAIVARGDYGGEFVTAVGNDRVMGVQFHPEKSSLDGLRVLRSFAATSARCAT